MTLTAAGAPGQRADLPAGYARLADPKVLPTALSQRFAVLVLMIIATTASVYGHLATLVTPAAERATGRCLASAGTPIANQPGPDFAGAAALRCVQQSTTHLAVWAGIGIALVLFLTLLLYAVQPWLAAWRRPVLDPVVWPDIHTTVTGLADDIGLSEDPLPTIVIDPSFRTHARTFGWRRRTWIRISAGLLVEFQRRPEVFRGVLLHELAHVRNRDNRATGLTVATWRAFMIVVLVPYLVGVVAPTVFGGQTGWRWPDPRVFVAVVVLTVLVCLTTRSVLRARETYADATAYQHDPTDTLRAELLTTTTSERWTLLRNHFPPARRRAMLGDPTALAGPDSLAMFGAGVAVSLLMINLWLVDWWTMLGAGGIGATMFRLTLQVALGVGGSGPDLLLQLIVYGPIALLVSAVVAGLAAVTGWRTALLARYGHAPLRTWRSAVPFAAGMLLGMPLSVSYADAGIWGVFDSGVVNDIRDVALTAVGLLLIVTVAFRWTAESATAWLRDDGSLRRLCALTAVIGALAALPLFFIWVMTQNTLTLGWLILPHGLPRPVSGWPMTTVVLAQYIPLNGLVALPGCVLLFGIGAAFPLWGTVRRHMAHRWRRAVRWAPIGIAVAVVVPLVVATLVHGGTTNLGTITRTVPGSGLYLIYGIVLLIAVIAALSGVVASRLAGGLAWSVGLFVATTVSAFGSLVAPIAYVTGLCGPTGFGCFTAYVPGERTLYGGIAQSAPTDALILTVLFMLLANTIWRPRLSYTDSTRGAVSATVLATTGLAVLAFGVFCYGRFFARIW